jgi:membrane-associated phospholipid phosphatase
MSRWAAAAAACALAFGTTALLAHTDVGQGLDDAGLRAAVGLPGSREAWIAASWPGESTVALALVAAAAVACAALGGRRPAFAAAAASLSFPVVAALKWLIARERPEAAMGVTSFAFPSGHAAGAAVAFGVLALLLAPAAVRRGAPAWLVPAAIALWLAVSALVGLARVASGVHWPLDVVGAWAWAGLVLSLAGWVASRAEPALSPPSLA